MRRVWGRTRRLFWLAAVLFAGGIGLGLLLAAVSPAFARQLADLIGGMLSPVAQRARDLGNLGFLAILVNNLRASLIIIALGPTFVLPVLAMLVNGLALGVIASTSLAAGRMTLGQVLLTIAPHGIFELPAIFLAVALSWRLGAVFWGLLLRRPVPVPPGQIARDAWRTSLLMVALLIPAALIEFFISASFAPHSPF